jgi:hypothetical protein
MSKAYFHVIHMSIRLPFPSPPEVPREPLQVRRLDRTRLQSQRRRQTGRDPGMKFASTASRTALTFCWDWRERGICRRRRPRPGRACRSWFGPYSVDSNSSDSGSDSWRPCRASGLSYVAISSSSLKDVLSNINTWFILLICDISLGSWRRSFWKHPGTLRPL